MGGLHAEEKKISVGWKSIIIPAINGFESNKDLETLLKNTAHPDLKIFGVFRASGKFDRSRKRYFIISTSRLNEDANISINDFSILSKDLKASHGDIVNEFYSQTNIKRVNSALSKSTGIKTELSFNDTTSLGVFLENDTALGIISVAKVSGKFGTNKVAKTSVPMLLKGKIIVINIHSEFDSMSDIEWLKNKSKTWSDKIIKANKESLFGF